MKIPKGNHNPYIEQKQTTHWPKEKVQKDKQRSTKQTHKTKDRVTRTPLKTRAVGGRKSVVDMSRGVRNRRRGARERRRPAPDGDDEREIGDKRWEKEYIEDRRRGPPVRRHEKGNDERKKKQDYPLSSLEYHTVKYY